MPAVIAISAITTGNTCGKKISCKTGGHNSTDARANKIGKIKFTNLRNMFYKNDSECQCTKEKREKEKQVINKQGQPLASVNKKKPGVKTGKAAPAKPYSHHHHKSAGNHQQWQQHITMINQLLSKQRQKSSCSAKSEQCNRDNHIGIMMPLHIGKQLDDCNLVGNKRYRKQSCSRHQPAMIEKRPGSLASVERNKTNGHQAGGTGLAIFFLNKH